jgi:hypothetical protein
VAVPELPLGPEVAVLDPGEFELEPLPPPPDVCDVCEPPALVAAPLEWELEPESVKPPGVVSELEEHAASATMAVVVSRRTGDLMTRVPPA